MDHLKNLNRLNRRIKLCIWIVIVGLAVSGITAFPLESELGWLVSHTNFLPPQLTPWLIEIHQALKVTNQTYPYLAYGTDWLAFAHIMLAVLFIGPLRNPVKNIWVIQFGIIACVAIIPLAVIAAPVRHIPWYWTLVDCSFGVFGIIPLIIAHRLVKQVNNLISAPSHQFHYA